MARLVDLSHEIEHGMVTYRGLPAPVISDWLPRQASSARYAAGTTFQIGRIDLLANTGTYIDAPFHRYDDGRDVAGYRLEAVADLPGVLVHATSGPRGRGGDRAIDASRFAGLQAKGKAVLVHTGWDAHWRTDTYSAGEHPFLTRDAAEHLAKAGAALVGIDSLNIDDDKDGTRPAHTILLGAGVAIVEHMTNLGALPDAGFRFFAVPPKVKGMGSFPVRAFAMISRLCVTIVLLGSLGACLRTDVPDRERPAVLTADDLAPYGISVPDPAGHESLKRYVYFDGARMIEYEYNVEPDSTGLYLYAAIDIERDPRYARQLVVANKAAMIAGFWVEKIEVRNDSTMQYGDDSYFGALLRDSAEVGKLAVARRGVIVYTVVVTGYLLDSGDWYRLLDAKFHHADSLLPPASSRQPSPRR